LRFYSTSKGVFIKKGLVTKMYPFSEIKRIELDEDGESYFLTTGHEEFKDSALHYALDNPRVYDEIRKNNIAFINHDLKKFHEKTYTEEELLPLLSEPKEVAQECADKFIRRHLGEEFSVDVVLDKDYEHYQLYFILKRNGEVMALPWLFKLRGGRKYKDSFEGLILTDLLEWKASSKSGIYGVTEEVTDPEYCRFIVNDKMKDFCEFYAREKAKGNDPVDFVPPKPVERLKPKDHLQIRYPVFLLGLFIASLGVAFSTVAELGTSPVASVPYSIFLADGGTTMSFGGWLNLLSIIQITVQILILRRKCYPLEILIQTILAFVYGYLTNFSCWLLRDICPARYEEKLFLMLLGCIILALGIWIQFKGGVAMLPGEAMNRAISEVTGKRYENIKIAFDIFYITLSAIICMSCLGRLEGVREGSIVAAVLVGLLIRLYNRIINKAIVYVKKSRGENE